MKIVHEHHILSPETGEVVILLKKLCTMLTIIKEELDTLLNFYTEKSGACKANKHD